MHFLKFWIFCLLVLGLFLHACNSSHSKSSLADSESLDSLEIVDTVAIMEPEELDTIPRDILLGRFDPAKSADFSKISATYGSGSGLGAYLHTECLEAFKKMYAAAKAEGVQLKIISATRNFYRQKQIWEAKWNGQRKVGGKNLSTTIPDPAERATKILLYSSMPGTSRHHWGTDMDINQLENAYFEKGKGLKEYTWLVENAASFGFGQPYSAKGTERPDGYEEEKWHWSYLPIAKKYLKAYGHQINPEDILGFDGAEVAKDLKVIDRYVFGIAESCK